MPATVTYLQLDHTHACPLRVFIHRKHVLGEHQVAVNEKSILTLSAAASIRLSNHDLNHLLQDLSAEIQEALLHTPLATMFPKRALSRASVLVRPVANTWKCKLVVSLGYIVDLRYGMGLRFSAADAAFLDHHSISAQPAEPRSALLERSFSFSFSDHLTSLDDKKHVKYAMENRVLLNDKLTDPLTLYVTSRPRAS